MAVSAKMYTRALRLFQSGGVDLVNDDIKVALLANTYTPDMDLHEFWSDVSAHEVSGTGYTAGGASLTNKTLTIDAENDRSIYDADDVSWANSTITARYAVIYNNTPATDVTKQLIALVDFGEDKSSVDATFAIQWSADGICMLTAL